MAQQQQKPVALVTGTAGELGACIASTLAEQGICVAGLDLKAAEPGVTARDYLCDLSDFEALAETLARIEEELGCIEVLVNNAAYYKDTPFFELTPQQLQMTMTVNVSAVMFLCQQVSKRMIDANKPGAIVNMASIAGRNGSSQADYGASKAGIINITTTLGRVLGPHGIRINAVAPGLLNTGMGTRLGPGVREKLLAATPLQRAAEPQEVADVVAYLLSDQASYINGTTIDVHGGL